MLPRRYQEGGRLEVEARESALPILLEVAWVCILEAVDGLPVVDQEQVVGPEVQELLVCCVLEDGADLLILQEHGGRLRLRALDPPAVDSVERAPDEPGQGSLKTLPFVHRRHKPSWLPVPHAQAGYQEASAILVRKICGKARHLLDALVNFVDINFFADRLERAAEEQGVLARDEEDQVLVHVEAVPELLWPAVGHRDVLLGGPLIPWPVRFHVLLIEPLDDLSQALRVGLLRLENLQRLMLSIGVVLNLGVEIQVSLLQVVQWSIEAVLVPPVLGKAHQLAGRLVRVLGEHHRQEAVRVSECLRAHIRDQHGAVEGVLSHRYPLQPRERLTGGVEGEGRHRPVNCDVQDLPLPLQVVHSGGPGPALHSHDLRRYELRPVLPEIELKFEGGCVLAQSDELLLLR